MKPAADTTLNPGVPPEISPEASADARPGTAPVADDAARAAPSSDEHVQLGGKLAGLSLSRQVAVLAVWPFFQQLLNWFVSAVDTAVAARLSVPAANAIGVTGYIGWLMGLLSMTVGAGAAALIARAVGGRHRGLANAGLAQALLIASVWGLCIGAGMYAGAEAICQATGLVGESLELAVLYLRILAVSAPLASLLFVGSMSLSGAGDTRSPFWVMLAVNLVNVGLTLELVSRGYGVAGIAIGTTVAYGLGGIIILGVLLRPGGPIRLRGRRLKPHAHTIRRILRVAAPNLVDRLGHWLGNFAVLMIVGFIAAHEMAPGSQDVLREAAAGSGGGNSGGTSGGGESPLWGAHIVAIRIEAISFLPGMAFAVAAATLTGQYLGAGSARLARRAAVYCWAVGAGLMTVMGLTFIAVPELWCRLMTDEPQLLALSPKLVRICGFVQVFFGSYLVLSEAMRGAGDTRWPMILSNVSTWCVRLPAVWIVGVELEGGLVGVWYAICGELIVRGLIFAARFRHGGWLKARV